MPRATCRCGEILTFPVEGPERIVCPKCAARIRVRRTPVGRPVDEGDGFFRFACPCGRRLKVRIDEDVPEAGQCPDCGRVVTIPASRSSSQNLPTSHPESLTEELSAADLSALEQWKQRRLGSSMPAPAPVAGVDRTTETMPLPVQSSTPEPQPSSATTVEAGLRMCPRCSKPVHMSAIVCRTCGAHVPKR